MLVTFSLEKGGNVRSKKRYENSFFCKYFPLVGLVFEIFLRSFFDLRTHENMLQHIVLSVNVLPMCTSLTESMRQSKSSIQVKI